VPSVPQRAAGSLPAPSAAPAQPEATPLTSEVPARSGAGSGGGRREPSTIEGERWRWNGRRALGLAAIFVVFPILGAGLVFGVRRMQRTPSNGHEPPAAAVAVVASASGPTVVTEPVIAAPTILPSSVPSLLATVPAPPPPPPATSASVAAVAAIAPASSTTSPARAKAPPPPKAPLGKPAPAKPSGGAQADDGRDLLYVPPKQP